MLFIGLVVALSVYFIRMQYHEARVETIKTDMLQVQWKVKDYIDKQIVKGEEKKYLGTKLSEMKEDLVLKDEDLATATLKITNYKDSYFIINYDTYEVLVSKGCKYSENEVLYKLSDIINKSSEIEKN